MTVLLSQWSVSSTEYCAWGGAHDVRSYSLLKCHCEDNLCFGLVSFLSVSTLMTLQPVLPANCCTARTALFQYHQYLLSIDCWIARLCAILILLKCYCVQRCSSNSGATTFLIDDTFTTKNLACSWGSGTLCRQERTRASEEDGLFGFYISLDCASSHCGADVNALLIRSCVRQV